MNTKLLGDSFLSIKDHNALKYVPILTRQKESSGSWILFKKELENKANDSDGKK